MRKYKSLQIFFVSVKFATNEKIGYTLDGEGFSYIKIVSALDTM